MSWSKKDVRGDCEPIRMFDVCSRQIWSNLHQCRLTACLTSLSNSVEQVLCKVPRRWLPQKSYKATELRCHFQVNICKKNSFKVVDRTKPF